MNEGIFVALSLLLNVLFLYALYHGVRAKRKKKARENFDPVQEVDELVKSNEEFIKKHGATEVMSAFSGLIMVIQELHPSNKELQLSLQRVIKDKYLLAACMNSFKFANKYMMHTQGRIGIMVEVPKEGDIIEQFRDLLKDKGKGDLPN